MAFRVVELRVDATLLVGSLSDFFIFNYSKSAMNTMEITSLSLSHCSNGLLKCYYLTSLTIHFALALGFKGCSTISKELFLPTVKKRW